MTRTDVAIADIARALCSVDPKLKNRQAIFEETLRGFLESQLERYRQDLVAGSCADYEKFEEIRKSARSSRTN